MRSVNSFETLIPRNWRTMASDGSVSSPSTIKTNSNVNQKKGAERLFQYFEADDSDPEDYAR